MAEILFNPKINNYTLQLEIDGVKSIKKVPLKFKIDDTTSKYRKESLKDKILNN